MRGRHNILLLLLPLVAGRSTVASRGRDLLELMLMSQGTMVRGLHKHLIGSNEEDHSIGFDARQPDVWGVQRDSYPH
jgi:hypothetical protein